MRLALILEQPLEVGGGFQQPLNDLLRLDKWVKTAENELVVYSPHSENIQLLSKLGFEAELLKIGWRDYAALFMKYFRAFDLAQIVLRYKAPLERMLLKRGIDVVYFTAPSKWHLLLYQLPFIITIFDGCHRDVPEFEEVRAYGEFERREILFRSAVTKAVLVVTNAKELIDALCRRYAMEPERAVCIPFSPSTYISQSAIKDPAQNAAILQKYNLEPGYLFYPAQFWHHKNHATLITALALLRDRGIQRRLVLCGSNRGAREQVEELISRYSLTSQVSILGFVDSAELSALYGDALALVMPSYFGPTNLPPLEAWAVDTPVIYPKAFEAQVGDAAILFDYDSPHSLADAIIRVDSLEERNRLRLAGEERLRYFCKQIEAGHNQFAEQMRRLKYRLTLLKQ
jgi:glycosyltransferase involved in cell wall biosynthesis